MPEGVVDLSELVRQRIAAAEADTAALAVRDGATLEAARAAFRERLGLSIHAEAYYHVFNRSDDANRVQDVLTAIAFPRRQTGGETVNVVGMGQAGLWVLLAAALDTGDLTVVADLELPISTGFRGSAHRRGRNRGRVPRGLAGVLTAGPDGS